MFRACITLVASLDSGTILFEKSSQSMVWWNDCFGWQISTDGIGQFFAHWDLPGCLLWRNLDMVSWSPNMSDDRLRCIFDHISHDQGDCVAWKQKSQDSLCIVLGWAILCWAEVRGCPRHLPGCFTSWPLSDLSRDRAIVLSGEDSRHVLCLHWSLNSKLNLIGFK